MRSVLSLFDYTGQWTEPYWQAGNDVLRLDTKTGFDVEDLNVSWFMENTNADFDLIFAAPPCTDFTVSGAQYWKTKDLNGTTAASLELVFQILKCVEFLGPEMWVIENPVGRLPKLIPGLGKPFYFNPCDFAGYLDSDESRLDEIRSKNGVGVTADEAEFVMLSNAYTKKTGLWGKFNVPDPRPIEPVKCCPQGSFTQRLGGKSANTKSMRSITPAGFSQAFFEANENHFLNNKKGAKS